MCIHVCQKVHILYHKELANVRILSSVMYNMEIYCTSLYCIENPYWTRSRRRRVQYRFSIQYGRVQYISIFYITLYNDLFSIQLKWSITITTIVCLTFNSLNRTTAQQYFVRKMFCINTDLVNSKNELKTAK
jgi:hypothetical protein